MTLGLLAFYIRSAYQLDKQTTNRRHVMTTQVDQNQIESVSRRSKPDTVF